MKAINFALLVAGASLGILAVPASAAITLDAGHCTSLSVSDGGCRFLGVNLANAGQAATVQGLYNAYAPALPGAPISLANLLGTNNISSGFGAATAAADSKSGSWTTPGYLIDYIAVSGGNQTILYSLGGVSQGDWSTFGLVNGGGNQPGLSHLAFFGRVTAVPEPASWAMLIAGMGLVGAAMRRRKVKVSFG